MTRIPLVTRVFLGSLVVVLIAGAQSSMQTRHDPARPFIALQPEELRPADGATQKILFGDPAKPGMYVVENTFVPGRTSRPHFHDQDRYITVVKGTWWVSTGPEADTYDPAKMVPMKTGSFVFHPAFGHHYDGAKDEPATVRIMGMGPVTTTQLEQQSAR
jgi:quercetin dioxygenase-like cupin family protein